MKKNFFLLFLAIVFISGTFPVVAAEGNISDDLNSILKTFKGENEQRAPTLDELYPATGTLIFFGNQNHPKQMKEEKKSSNFIERTLERAKARLFKREAEQQKNAQQNFPKKFVNPKIKQEENYQETPPQQTLRLMELNFDGPKTQVSIPPDAIVEVPFLTHIPYFFSRIEIYGDNSIGVTETIQRIVEENDIKPVYGINRYFSKYHNDRMGRIHRTLITVLDASIDGQPAEAKVLPTLFGVKVAVNSDTPLEPGNHVFTLTYLMPDKIAEFQGDTQENSFKELIWSVTGEHWPMPITRAAAVLIFPKDAKVLSQSAATGNAFNPSRNFKIKRDEENNLSFSLSYPLADGEGLTIFANWQDPLATALPSASALDKFIAEHGTSAAATIAFLFILSYYVATWLSLKKNQNDSKEKTKPVQKGDFSPGVLYYALTKKTDSKALLILLTSMASKGFLKLGETENGVPQAIKTTDNETSLSAVEKKIARTLFPKNATSFDFNKANALALTRLQKKISSSLKKEYDQKFVTMHQSYFWFGILMAVVSVIFVSYLSLFGLATFFTALGCVALIIPAYFLFSAMYAEAKGCSLKASWTSLLLLGIAAAPFLIAEFFLLYFYALQTTAATAFMMFCTVICIAVFYSLLKSPSLLGKSVLENTEGYKLYLSDQSDTLLTAMRNATQKIKSLYSKHLPFALAFNLGKLWTQRFAAFAEDKNDLKPDWYNGSLAFDENFADNLEKCFNDALPKPALNEARDTPKKRRLKKRPLK